MDTPNAILAAVEARAAELERQAAELRRRAELEISMLEFAAQELRALVTRLSTPDALPSA